MANEINSLNWTIDNFNGSNLSSTNDFRQFLFSKNLPDIPPEIQRFLPTVSLDDRGQEYNISVKSLTDPGSVDEWVNEGGFPTSVFEIRHVDNLSQNKYGPAQTITYNIPELIPEDTGFIQYQTSSGTDFRSSLVGQQLGFGYAAGLKFDSNLNEIGKKQRKEEFKQRAIQNFKQDTVGKINLDPFGLLAGQDLYLKDYTITKGPGIGGEAVNLLSDLSGINTPTSIIPEGAFGSYGPKNNGGDDSKEYETILKYTGAGTKSLLYSALDQNKYGPTVSTDTGPPPDGNVVQTAVEFTKKTFGPGDAPIMKKYTDKPDDTELRQERELSNLDKANRAVSNQIESLINKVGGVDGNVKPETEVPTTADDPTLTNTQDFGFDTLLNIATDTWEIKGSSPTLNIPAISPNAKLPDLGAIGTQLPIDGNMTVETHLPLKNGMFWQPRTGTSPFKKGILKYTQKLINSAKDNPRSSARFVGKMNSDTNFTEDGLHKEYSKGNLATRKSDGAYCRSWSVRRAYDTYGDLIRNDAAWRTKQPPTSTNPKGSEDLSSYTTLRKPGVPKIAWEYDDIKEAELKNRELQARLRNEMGRINEDDVIPYMFSIENLAWKDAPHYSKLRVCEKGPHGGRIMWFPPYNINFTDNTSVNWDSTNFIGRGEPIYTYNNTERTGTLSFSLVVDHPGVLNSLREELQVNLESFFAGCDVDTAKKILDRAFPELEKPEEEEIKKPDPIETDINLPDVDVSLKYYFKNARCLDSDKIGRGSCRDNSVEDGGNTNSSCPESYIGRCIDENYEVNDLEAIDNINLYTLKGADKDAIYDEILLFSSIPDNGTPPCPGDTTKDQGNIQVGGIKSGGWGKIDPDKEDEDTSNYSENKNFCLETTPKTIVDSFGNTGTTETHGIKYIRESFNKKFFSDYEFEVGGVTYKGIDGLAEFLTTPIGKGYRIEVDGGASSFGGSPYNDNLAIDRALNLTDYLYKKMEQIESGKDPVNWEVDDIKIPLYNEKDKAVEDRIVDNNFGGGTTQGRINLKTTATGCGRGKSGCRWSVTNAPITSSDNWTFGNFISTPARLHPGDYDNENQIKERFAAIKLVKDESLIQDIVDQFLQEENKRLEQEHLQKVKEVEAEREKEKQDKLRKAIEEFSKGYVNECDYFAKIKEDQPFLYDTLREKLNNFHPAFHSTTPESFNSRLTFLQQCTRQGPSFIDPNQPQNTAFGRPPICILRIGDFYFSKIVIDTVNFSFDPLQWDLNPEGVGVQPMVCSVDLNFKFIGGSTITGPLRQLQNAVSYNFFANTSLYQGLEKIVAKRGKTGFSLEGSEEFENSNERKETFWYGPFASQQQADIAYETNETIKRDNDPNEENLVLKSSIEEQLAQEGNKETDNQENRDRIEEETGGNLEIEDTTEVSTDKIIKVKDQGFEGDVNINFGDIESARVGKWTVEIENTSSKPITVSDVNYGIDTTVTKPGYDQRKTFDPILPNESLSLSFTTVNGIGNEFKISSGLVTRNLIILLSDGKQIIFQLIANIV